MMERQPRIGITTGAEKDWLPSGPKYEAYAAAIRTAGGQPVRLDAALHVREHTVFRELDGLLFTGGWDIDLRLYPRPPKLESETPGERMARGRMQVELERDRYEIRLALAALEADRPILGICRGCQLLHVALGGQLVLDIESEVETAIRHPSFPGPERLSSRHPLAILPGTRLADILAPDQHQVTNSRHHQAVLPDPSLQEVIAAISPDDGIVEAIEVTGRRFALGVQWHPEHPQDNEIREAHRPLFAALIAACQQARHATKRAD
jgi:putative glutamine amidotransferase